MRIFLGLGVNLGDRAAQLQRAVYALQKILTDVHCSPIYESAALLPDNAPAEWNAPFFNMAISGETVISAQALLVAIKQCEQMLGRKLRGHWGPREIDIDILAYGDQVIEQPDLIIPHAGLLRRDFALIPLADIAPDWLYPVKGKYYGMTARALAATLPNTLHKPEINIQ